MNVLKKVYCRSVQLAFKIALPLLPYRKPQVLDSLDEIPTIIEKLNYKNMIAKESK